MKQTSICGIFFLFLFSLTVYGQKDTLRKHTATDKRLEAFIPPKPRGWVSDFENVFTPKQSRYLDSMLEKHEEKTTNEIAVVTLRLDSVSIPSLKVFEELSLALFKKWGVGKKEKNNGLGILFSTHLRRIRIETGYGLVGKLTDKEAKNIIDTIILPEFKKGNYFTGIVNALDRIFKEIE